MRQFHDGLWEFFGVIKINKALDEGPLYDDSRIIFESVWLFLQVVRTDGSACNDSALISDVHEQLV